ncbi:hypothetical protein D3C85_1822320 [compost metagenome]
MLMATCLLTCPAFTRAGQRTMPGTRMPPSSSSVFCPLNGQVFENRSPPLSLVKTTMVFSASPCFSSACNTRPMEASSATTILA